MRVNKNLCLRIVLTLVATIAAVGLAVIHFRHRQPQKSPAPSDSPTSTAEIRTRAVELAKRTAGQHDAITASPYIEVIIGADSATADRYEERSDALRAISRERSLSTNDVAALVAYLESPDETLRVERVAALKNDVMNLLRNQRTPPSGFADTLVTMFECGDHPPAVLDYCIQHLGAVIGEPCDSALRHRIHSLLVKAAGRANQPYAGTAIYALAEEDSSTPAQEAELRRLTLSLCAPGANPVARIAAIQLAGQRGYAEALPLLRAVLSSPRRDAVTDLVCIGSLGLLDDAGDLPLLRRYATMEPRYATAAETAIHRIEEREAADGER